MGGLDGYKPALFMSGLQFANAVGAFITRAAFLQGMSPRVFTVYSQAIATLVMAPIAYLSSRRKVSRSSMGLRSFCLIFLASLIGVTANQNLFFEGLYLAPSMIASAMTNLIPAITFVMASIIGFEKVNVGSLRSIAKIGGTFFCVSGAISMALLRGPKLLNTELLPTKSFLVLGGENWLLGCLFLFGSSCCWSFWLILQVPVLACYPDHLSLSAWLCFFATLQSATVTLFLERDPEAWNLHSSFELACCLFSGILGSGLCFFLHSWCISRRGPLFSAMFNPLCTVIVTILGSLFLQEEVYTGSLVGAVAVIVGLYVVLWGKAKDFEENKGVRDLEPQNDHTQIVQVLIDESSDTGCKLDLEEPLLADKSTNVVESEMNHNG